MSLKQFVYTILCGFAFAYASFYYQTNFENIFTRRSPASTADKAIIYKNSSETKELFLKSKVKKIFEFNKVSQGFQISIEAPNGIAEKDEQETILKAKIIAMKDFKGIIKYHWSVPKDSEVLSVETPIADLDSPNEIKNFKFKQMVQPEISLINFSKQGNPKSVILQVFTEENGVTISQSAVFSTKDLYIPEIQNQNTENKDAPVLEVPPVQNESEQK